MNYKVIFLFIVGLYGCSYNPELSQSSNFNKSENSSKAADIEELKEWWTFFKDPVLDSLVNMALSNSPKQSIAKASIEFINGTKKSIVSESLPMIELSAHTGKSREGNNRLSKSFYDGGIGFSYDFDLSGKHKQMANSINERLNAAEAELQNVRIHLVGEVVATYIDYCSARKQRMISQQSLDLQKNILNLVQRKKMLGESSQMDVERLNGLVNEIKASIVKYGRHAKNARMKLAVLIGIPQEKMPSLPNIINSIPSTDIVPLMSAPTDSMANRPDIMIATALLNEKAAITKAATAKLYPDINLSLFYGLAKGTFFDSETIWKGVINAAVNLFDFGRIEGEIETAKAHELIAYQQYRDTILNAAADIEMAIIDYSHISEQRILLKKAHKNSSNAFNIARVLYREGEISFLDVLQSQRTLYSTSSALAFSEAAQSQSIVRLYRSLGVL